MSTSSDIKQARLLFGDLLINQDRVQLIDRIIKLGFTEDKNNSNNTRQQFTAGDIDGFLKKLEALELKDIDGSLQNLSQYIREVLILLHKEEALPFEVIVVEVLLKEDYFSKLPKKEAEEILWDLSLFLARCFSENNFPAQTEFAKNVRLLDLSSRVIRGPVIKNFVMDFDFQIDIQNLTDLSRELDDLEDAMSTKHPDPKDIEVKRDRVLDLEPISFYGSGFSYEQTIVRGYFNELFLVGKIATGSLEDSCPLYLFTVTSDENLISLSAENKPALQFPESSRVLDLTFGAGQILMLQLLNSWNRYVSHKIGEVAQKTLDPPEKDDIKLAKTLKDIDLLHSVARINSRVDIIYRDGLEGLISPPQEVRLYEFGIPDPLFNLPWFRRDEKIVSRLATNVLNYLDINIQHEENLESLRTSELGTLKIKEDRNVSRKMVGLTAVILIATVINIALFVISIPFVHSSLSSFWHSLTVFFSSPHGGF